MTPPLGTHSKIKNRRTTIFDMPLDPLREMTMLERKVFEPDDEPSLWQMQGTRLSGRRRRRRRHMTINPGQQAARDPIGSKSYYLPSLVRDAIHGNARVSWSPPSSSTIYNGGPLGISRIIMLPTNAATVLMQSSVYAAGMRRTSAHYCSRTHDEGNRRGSYCYDGTRDRAGHGRDRTFHWWSIPSCRVS
jgi:hypothetical protein